MLYEEKIDSKGVGYGLIVIGALCTLLPFGWLSYVGSKDDLSFYGVVERTIDNFPASILVTLVFSLFFLFAGYFFTQAYREIKANGDWIARVFNNEVLLLSPSEKLEKDIVFSIDDINIIEKIIKDTGDNDESIIWTFFLKRRNITIKYFGTLDIDALVNFITKNYDVKLEVRNFDVRGNEI
ncbi:hypothetical protein C1E23_20630 [Pseudoalteromonas phenolica]|uniref:Uncharacterized protein n=1 Tax=Pseudoalteromonas phenolica TaxID=161398 RepID=A0A4Q7IHE3_9GAMM|nr:hypothetical protein [Pseudoalteromonas phenolica]RZQ51230.1 hypothetical protein C1E23_20630 [Pseudoalteromonas phenolica]